MHDMAVDGMHMATMHVLVCIDIRMLERVMRQTRGMVCRYMWM